MCTGRRVLWLPLASLAMLIVMSGQECIPKPNGWPIANAGPDQTKCPGEQVFLDFTASSDPDGDSLTYLSVKIRGPADIVLDGANTATPSFLPPMEGEYEISLTVKDRRGATDEDTVVIHVSSENCVVPCSYPEARARTDRPQTCEGQSVNLIGLGSVSSPACPITDWSWRQIEGLAVDIANPYSADTTFVAPMVDQDVQLTFELTVTNGTYSDTDTVVITVLNCDPGECQTPVANAGPDQTVNENTPVALDGSGSYDPQDGQIAPSWIQTSGPAVTLSSPTAAKPTFTTPDVGSQGAVLVFQLTVSKECADGTTLTATDEVTITVVEPQPGDSDGDGVPGASDICPNTPLGEVADANGCSCSQKDADGDGVNDCDDQCPNTPAGEVVDNNGCSCSQKDSDGDGVNDCDDQCLNTPAGELADANGCSCSQKDTDSDGVNDCNDQCPNTPAGQAVDGQGCPVDSARTDTITLISGTLNGQSLNTNRPSITVEAGQTLTGTLNWRVYQDFDSGAVYPAVRTHTWATNHAASYVVLDDWVTRNEVPKTIADSINLTAPTTPGTYYIVTGGWPVTNAACIAANDYPTATFGDGDDLADQPGSVLETSWDGVGQYTNVSGFLGSYTQPMAGYAVRMIVQAPTPDGMVLIPAGTFQMGNALSATGEGDTDELPVHVVNLNAFRIDPYEATNQDYADALNWAMNQGGLISVPPLNGVVYRSGGTSIPYCNTTASEYDTHITWDGASFGVTPGKENHPMVRVTWWGAAAYANWRSVMSGRQPCYSVSTWNCDFSKNGYRLPTEAEWEKAARGGVTGRRFPWSDTDTIQHTRANYYSSSSYSYDTGPTRGYHPLWGVGGYPWTSPVGFFNGELRQKVNFNWPGSQATYQTTNGANGYGLYDMAGNVWEWCNDWYSSTYYSTPEASQPNPRGPLTATPYRAIRGGNSWGHAADWCRVADRVGGNGPDAWSSHVGFRLARNSE